MTSDDKRTNGSRTAQLEALTEENVLEALEDFAARGRDEFMRHYALRATARSYFIRHQHRGEVVLCDMKPVARAAVGQAHGEFANSKLVCRRLRELHFDVVHEAPTPPDTD